VFDDSVGATGEVHEQIEFLRRQSHFEAANIHAARGEVDTEVADVQTGDFRRALTDAAQRRPDAGEELVDAERLGDLVVGA
jgi:hypothetical protein